MREWCNRSHGRRSRSRTGLANGRGDLYAVSAKVTAQAAGSGACDPEAAVAFPDDAGGLGEPCQWRGRRRGLDAGAREDAAAPLVGSDRRAGGCPPWR